MKFEQILRDLREERGIAQDKFAKDINYSKSIVSDWERGKKLPNTLAIIAIAKYFGVSADYLLGLETEDGRKIVDLTEDRPEGEEKLTFPAAARSKGNKIRGGIMLKLTREQLDEIYRQNGIDPEGKG